MKKLLLLLLSMIAVISCNRYDDLSPDPPSEPLNKTGEVFMEHLRQIPGWEQVWNEVSQTGTPQPNLAVLSGNGREWKLTIPLVKGKQIQGLAFFPILIAGNSSKFIMDRPRVIYRDSIPKNFEAQRFIRSEAYNQWRNKGLKMNMTLPPISIPLENGNQPVTRSMSIRGEAEIYMDAYINYWEGDELFVTTLSPERIQSTLEGIGRNVNTQMQTFHCATHNHEQSVAKIIETRYNFHYITIQYLLQFDWDVMSRDELFSRFISTTRNWVSSLGYGFKCDMYVNGYGFEMTIPSECNPDDPTGGGFGGSGPVTPPTPPADTPKSAVNLTNNSKFAGYATIKNCHSACVQILRNHGLTSFGSPNNVIKLMYETGNPTELVKYGTDPAQNYKNAIDCIDRHLDAGRPIIVGVNHDLNYRPKSNNYNPINEGTTDHFVVINGRGYENGLYYYTYYEVGTSYTDKGCDNNANRLIYDPSGPYFYDLVSGLRDNPRFDVTQVRPNDGNTTGTTSQNAN